MTAFLLICILLLLYCVIGLIFFPRMRKKKQAEREMYKSERIAGDRGYAAKTTRGLEGHILNLSSDYESRKELLSKNTRDVCESTLSDLNDNYSEMIVSEWEMKVDRVLEEFLSAYGSVVESSFADVDKTYKLKKRCLSKYDAYWDITRQYSDKERSVLGETHIWDHAKMRLEQEFTSGGYFPKGQGIGFWGGKESSSKSPRQQIDEKLTRCIETMRPEYKRKMEVFDNILKYVHLHGSIPRVELLKTAFDGATQKEVESCCRSLIQDHRLIEVKIGGRLFVMLSDKEAAKHPILPPKTMDNESKGIMHTQNREKSIGTDYDMKACIQMLTEKSICHVDKTESGGCFWVEDSKESRLFTKSATINGRKFVHASSAKCFGGQPGWYLKKDDVNAETS